MIDSVARKEEGSKAREEREVSKRGKVVIREINGILVLGAISTCAHGNKHTCKWALTQRGTIHRQNTPKTHFGNAQVLNGGNLVPYTRRTKVDINPAPFSRCSTCSFQADVQQSNAPRRSSSRSLSGLM